MFEEITREEPEALMKAVMLKFPKDANETEKHLRESGFETKWIRQGTFHYVCHTGQEVYDHMMKSGAGTTFYYALKPSARERLANEFVRRVNERFQEKPETTITHEYMVGIGVCS